MLDETNKIGSILLFKRKAVNSLLPKLSDSLGVRLERTLFVCYADGTGFHPTGSLTPSLTLPREEGSGRGIGIGQFR